MDRCIVKSGICIWVALLLCLFNIRIEGSANTILAPYTNSFAIQNAIPATGQYAQYCEHASVLEIPTDNILEAKRASNRLATPATTIMLHGARRTVSIIDALQRIVRSQSTAQSEQSNCILYQSYTVVQAISSKRFHTGYYIYNRCQMRC